MNDNSFEDIVKLGCEERYEIFLDMVAEERDIWILVNEDKQFLKIYAEDDDSEFLPVWPHSDFTSVYSKGSPEKLTPKCVSVPEFFTKWVPGLEGDELKVGVFPNSGIDVWVMEPSELKSDLQEAFSAGF
ncbi:MAG: DUF2750 domain-containing protein [Agarilytica sp.]